MSEEEEYSEEEYEEEEEEAPKPEPPKPAPVAEEKPKQEAAQLKHVQREEREEEAPQKQMTEAERAMEAARRKKKEEDEARWAEYQQLREIEREKEEEELRHLKERQAQRRKERAEEEARLAEQRRAMEEQRQIEEEEIKKRREEEKARRKAEAERRRMELMGATGQTDVQISPNYVITKREGEEPVKKFQAGFKKTKEQLEEEKQGYLKKRVKPCNVSGWDMSRLKEKAQELHSRFVSRGIDRLDKKSRNNTAVLDDLEEHLKIIKLETDRYDLEQKCQRQEYDLKELAEREKQVKKQKMLKKGIDASEAESIHPPKVAVASKYDRQVDHRTYSDRKDLFMKPPPPPPEINRTGKVWTFPGEEGEEQPAPPAPAPEPAPAPPEEVAAAE